MVEVDIDIKLPLLYYGGINSITVIARIIFSIIVLILTMIITMFTMLATVLFFFKKIGIRKKMEQSVPIFKIVRNSLSIFEGYP